MSNPSLAERAALGRAARDRSPRAGQASYTPGPDRPDPIELLERQAATRVPELVPIRYGRMAVSPFAFYRGAATIMANDLAGTPSSALMVQCCGDAHLSNFGVFASPDRRLVFDINDFDETLPGPWEWDVKRLAVSMLIAARDNGFRPRQQQQILLDTVGAYRAAMRRFAGLASLAVWYARLDIERVLDEHTVELKPAELKPTRRGLAKARTRDSMSAFSKLTTVRDGEPRIIDQSPLIVPIDALAPGTERHELLDWLRGMVQSYRDTVGRDRRPLLEEFELTDFARKVVGVGSVGTRAWIALLLGRDATEPLFLQVKEAQASVLEEHVGASEFANHGERVVTGQRLMQAASDIFLGWLRVTGAVPDVRDADYYVRQLKDWKASVEIDELSADGMAVYGRLCGWTLARAHARSGDRVAIAAYLGGGTNFDRAMLEFADAYAEQNDRDYRRLRSAIESGRVQAQLGM